MSSSAPTAATILVVDDRLEARSLIAAELEESGFNVVEAADGVDGWKAFRREKPDLVVSDLRMPRADGIDLLQKIRSISSIPVILLTAYGDVTTAVAAMKGGAQEFLTFPDDLERVIKLANNLLENTRQSSDADQLAARVNGKSAIMQRVRQRIVGLASLDVPVLVSGERGSGRDHVVRVLHELGERSEPLVTIPAADALRAAVPRNGESVYLDEVADLAPEAQKFWLERIQQQDQEGDESGGRVYASTSVDLMARVAQGQFSHELSDFLARFTIPLPPLRDRLEDLAQLVPALTERIGEGMGRKDVRVQSSAIARLRNHPWPGNVRELHDALQRLIAFSSDGVITKNQVTEVIGEAPETVASARERRSRDQREELIALFDECGGNIAEVARRLDLSRGAVIYRAQKFGLVPKPRTR